MNLDPAAIRPEVIALVPEALCRKHRVLPVDRIENSLMLAMADPTNVFAMDEIKFMTGFDVVPIASTEAVIADAIERIVWSVGAMPAHADLMPAARAAPADAGEDADDAAIELADRADVSPIVRAINALLLAAVAQDATDVHITPGETGVRIGYRIDGVFREKSVLPLELRDALASRLKIMARLDIAEKRLPQDGRITIQLGGRQLPIRLATLPTSRGERIIMRIERPDLRPRTVDALGLPPGEFERLTRAVRAGSGFVLVAGGARSGRTTTLYALLRYLNDGTRAILTAEDRVQQEIDGVAQTVIRGNAGYTAAAAIRSMLRHDPDLIMVHRIDGEETATLLASAAAQGVAVLTSLDAEGAPEALIELARLAGGSAGVASSARFVMAQRLVRKRLFVEMMEVSPGIRKALAAGADAPELRRIAIGEGMSPFPVPE